ncbi:quinone oxidoreductase family protein [Geothrix oryzisoli]|uniref:quinone oxidoreductase family protein n=1 Tax=Geothrix oryzisoli TaxID=2922721 RepID=UPI001FABAB3A|nr:quinone oxidoreductase [Geothrix oryzisoli]
MSHRIQFTTPGGPEVLQWVEADLPDPGPGEVRLRHTAIGVNYIDVYHRSGAYPVPLPAVPGFEAAGVVEALGPGVTDLEVGQRVAYVDGPTGAYSEARNHPADRLVPLPAGLPDEAAAALLFKGLTAHMLVRRVWRAGAEPWVLVHAAAGGVGLILTRWLAREGAKVIGLVSSPGKARMAETEGAVATLVVPRSAAYDGVAAEVRRITGGRGVGTVFDSVGRDTFEASLDSLAPFGLLASFGRSSGPLPLVDPADLAKRGSLGVQRPSIFHHIADPATLRAAAAEVFAAQAQGIIRAHIHGTLPLREAPQAHALLESRATRGALVLLP